MQSLEVWGHRPARDGEEKTSCMRNQECNWTCLAKFQGWKQIQQAGEIAQWKHVWEQRREGNKMLIHLFRGRNWAPDCQISLSLGANLPLNLPHDTWRHLQRCSHQQYKQCKPQGCISTFQTTGIRYSKLVPIGNVGLRLLEYSKILQQRKWI